MELKTMPKKTAAELLAFLAENEAFASIESVLGDALSANDAKALLREMSTQLHIEANAEAESPELSKNPHLSRKAKQLVSCLSALEEKALSKAFGLTD